MENFYEDGTFPNPDSCPFYAEVRKYVHKFGVDNEEYIENRKKLNETLSEVNKKPINFNFSHFYDDISTRIVIFKIFCRDLFYFSITLYLKAHNLSYPEFLEELHNVSEKMACIELNFVMRYLIY